MKRATMRPTSTATVRRIVALAAAAWTTGIVLGQEKPPVEDPPAAVQPSRFAEPEGARRLAPNVNAWIDAKRKRIVLDGEVCLREGPLEMFACTRGTKEYESVVTVPVKAQMVHAALLVLGAKAGGPVQFLPHYVPARGTEIAIELLWFDADGRPAQARAQDWVRNVQTRKPLQHPWVFAGSGFWTDELTGKEYYQAESGDFICVSNFPSAMLDLPIESTQANEGLLFDAFSAHIPPVGTPVRLLLKPKLDEERE